LHCQTPDSWYTNLLQSYCTRGLQYPKQSDWRMTVFVFIYYNRLPAGPQSRWERIPISRVFRFSLRSTQQVYNPRSQSSQQCGIRNSKFQTLSPTFVLIWWSDNFLWSQLSGKPPKITGRSCPKNLPRGTGGSQVTVLANKKDKNWSLFDFWPFFLTRCSWNYFVMFCAVSVRNHWRR